MIASPACFVPPFRALAGVLLLGLGSVLSGCADMGDGMTSVFADPAKYALYDCKQLEGERKSLANRMAELQGLMGKAQTGVAGPVVAEVAYRNEYIAVRGQAKNADEAWAANKCHETPAKAATPTPTPTPTPVAKSGHGSRSGNAMSGNAVN
jgi:hypothetical protein